MTLVPYDRHVFIRLGDNDDFYRFCQPRARTRAGGECSEKQKGEPTRSHTWCVPHLPLALQYADDTCVASAAAAVAASLAQDLLMTVGSDLSTEDVRTAIKQFDTDNNGKVSFE